MPEFSIEIASRYLRRQFAKAVGRSVLKVLTELITNADDSYRRLSLASSTAPARLVVEFDRRKRLIAVTDQAEGLDAHDMESAFVTYGAESRDRAAGVRTRSLFGKGLRDVLFTQDDGIVKSIKDGKAFTCKFRWRDRSGIEHPTVDIQSGPPVTQELRAAWGILGNGTRVQFKLTQDVHVPQYDRLARDLENFYMLRRINSRDDRAVVLRTRDSHGGWEERPLRYSPPAPNATVALKSDQWTFKFEGAEIGVSVSLSAYESAMVQGEANYEEREGGLLIVDEDDDVLDLTLFGYDEEPAAARLFGELSVIGAGALIRSRLNSSSPEEILTETRDGFDKKHPFYKALRAQIEPWLKPFVEEERQRQGAKPLSLSADTRRRHERAFDRLNNLAKQLLGQTAGSAPGPLPLTPHIEGALQFRTGQATIRTGSYRSVPLLVNTLRVAPGSQIQVSASDTSVVFATDPVLEVPAPTAAEPTVSLSVRLEGLRAGDAIITAAVAGASADANCSVVDEDVPDLPSGIAFLPDAIDLRDGERGRLTLYTDLRIVGQADVPDFESTNPLIQVLTPQPRWEPVTNFIVKAAVSIVGRGKGEEALIRARLGGAEAVAYVKVISKRQEKDRREGGMFRGYKFATLERRIQAQLDTDGYVVVNLADPANKFHFGRDVAAATRALEERSSAQTLLAELVLEECIQRAVTEAYQNGKLPIRFPEDPTTDIRNYVAQQRFELGGEIHRLFVVERSPS